MRHFKNAIHKENGVAHGIILLPNVRDDLPPLAIGIRACSAGEMPKVPKAWRLGRSTR